VCRLARAVASTSSANTATTRLATCNTKHPVQSSASIISRLVCRRCLAPSMETDARRAALQEADGRIRTPPLHSNRRHWWMLLDAALLHEKRMISESCSNHRPIANVRRMLQERALPEGVSPQAYSGPCILGHCERGRKAGGEEMRKFPLVCAAAVDPALLAGTELVHDTSASASARARTETLLHLLDVLDHPHYLLSARSMVSICLSSQLSFCFSVRGQSPSESQPTDNTDQMTCRVCKCLGINNHSVRSGDWGIGGKKSHHFFFSDRVLPHAKRASSLAKTDRIACASMTK